MSVRSRTPVATPRVHSRHPIHGSGRDYSPIKFRVQHSQPIRFPRVWSETSMARTKLLEFGCTNWGGKRRGAGRKRKAPRNRVDHKRRPALSPRTPVHVTLRVRAGLTSLRTPTTHRLVLRVLLEACRDTFRVTHYAALPNHLHLLCEAANEESLSRGLQGLCIRLARRLNRSWARQGSVFDDHYHAHQLETPTEVRNALKYVLENAKRHGLLPPGAIDAYSSARWGRAGVGPFPAPRSWLLREGWKRVEDRARL